MLRVLEQQHLYRKIIACALVYLFADPVTYIKFPFGLMDYNGLKQLQLYHCDLHHKSVKEGIQTWLSQAGNIYGINMKKIKEFFSLSKSEHEKKLVNLTRDHWVTENEINELYVQHSKPAV